MKQHTFFLVANFAFLARGNFASAKVSPDEFVAACAAGDQAKVEKLLAAGAGVEAPNKLGHSPLLTAMWKRRAEIVELLLRRGANPNAEARCPEEGCGGHPALIFAEYLDDPQFVKLLLAAKADVAWRDHLTTRRANLGNKVEIYKMLKAAGGRESLESGPAAKKSTRTATPLPAGLAELLPAPKRIAPRASGENLRVAIVADDAMQTAGELLASELTGGGVQMVERADIDRVLAEQKLARTFGDAARAPQIGGLLKADALALLRKVELDGRELAELRVVRVSPGIVLGRASRAWPLADAAAWARDAAENARELLGKVRSPRALALSLAEVRSITATPAGDAFTREVALLVAGRLQRQPEVVLLERAAASDLSREISMGKPDAFWAGSFFVSGTVEPPLDASGEVAIQLRFAPVAGGPALDFSTRGARAKAAALIDGLIAQAAQKLALSPVAPTDALAEAARFFAESRAATESGAYLAAYRNAGSAALLDLRTPKFLNARLAAIFDAMEWQATRMNARGWIQGLPDEIRPEETLRAAWDEKLLRESFGNLEKMSQEEWLDAAMQIAPLWSELIREALATAEPQRIESALDLMHEAVAVPIFAREMLRTATGTIAFGDRLREIAPTVLSALVEALALADRKPELAEAVKRIVLCLVWNAPLLCEDEATLNQTLAPLLARHFSTMDLAMRAEIRGIILRYGDYHYQQVSIPERQPYGERYWNIRDYRLDETRTGALERRGWKKINVLHWLLAHLPQKWNDRIGNIYGNDSSGQRAARGHWWKNFQGSPDWLLAHGFSTQKKT